MTIPIFKRPLPNILGFSLLALLMLVLSTAVAFAEPKWPTQNGTRVIDEANLLDATQEHELDLKLKGLEDATTDQVVVVTVSSLQDYEIRDYGYQLGRHWGIGQKAGSDIKANNGQAYKDNGILLIVAPNERKVDIEVGYGLEPVLPDILAGRIIRNDILPQFKAGDYPAGINAGADAIITQLSMERGVAVQKAQDAVAAEANHGSSEKSLPLPVIIFIIIILLIFSRGWLPWLILGNILGSSGRGDWGGGGGGWSGGGGGGFSGGGGSFGGGGSSGSW